AIGPATAIQVAGAAPSTVYMPAPGAAPTTAVMATAAAPPADCRPQVSKETGEELTRRLQAVQKLLNAQAAAGRNRCMPLRDQCAVVLATVIIVYQRLDIDLAELHPPVVALQAEVPLLALQSRVLLVVLLVVVEVGVHALDAVERYAHLAAL